MSKTTVRRITYTDPEYWQQDSGPIVSRGVAHQSSAYVPALPDKQKLPAQTNHAMILDVTPSAAAHVEVRTSHQDRAKGYLISTVPLCGAFALCVVIVRTAYAYSPLLSMASLLWFWTTFCLFWLLSYIWGYVIQSPEFTMLYEARGKLKLLEREQKERWKYYNDR